MCDMLSNRLLELHTVGTANSTAECFIHMAPNLQGVEEMMSSGTLAGFPVVDVTATLYDGSFHDVDSSVLAFQIAARAAFREGMRKGAVRLLEPIMKVRASLLRLYSFESLF